MHRSGEAAELNIFEINARAEAVAAIMPFILD